MGGGSAILLLGRPLPRSVFVGIILCYVNQLRIREAFTKLNRPNLHFEVSPGLFVSIDRPSCAFRP